MQEIKVATREVVETIRELIHEGNVRRIIIRSEDGKHTYFEIPLTAGIIAALIVPILAAVGAAVGAIAALMTNCTIDVIKVQK